MGQRRWFGGGKGLAGILRQAGEMKTYRVVDLDLKLHDITTGWCTDEALQEKKKKREKRKLAGSEKG